MEKVEVEVGVELLSTGGMGVLLTLGAKKQSLAATASAAAVWAAYPGCCSYSSSMGSRYPDAAVAAMLSSSFCCQVVDSMGVWGTILVPILNWRLGLVSHSPTPS